MIAGCIEKDRALRRQHVQNPVTELDRAGKRIAAAGEPSTWGPRSRLRNGCYTKERPYGRCWVADCLLREAGRRFDIFCPRTTGRLQAGIAAYEGRQKVSLGLLA